LSHVIERAVLWSQGSELSPEHLALTRPSESPAAESGIKGAAESGVLPPPPGVGLEQWEKQVLEQALREAGGNQTKAASRLGISRDTLRYRIKKYGLG
jgi:two-component system, NtrC family, response regulator AtoC